MPELPVPNGDGNQEGEVLDAYLVQARSALLRSRSRGEELLSSARAGDEASRKLLLEGYLDLTSSLAMALRPDGLTELEAVQEANLALLDVIDSEAPDIPGALPAEITRRFAQPQES